jgi:hypothetical protein
MFLCAADVDEPFMENVAWHGRPQGGDVIYKFLLPASLRNEVIERLSTMNVTAATLFPDLGGLARSLRTRTVRRVGDPGALPPPSANALPPWIQRLKDQDKRTVDARQHADDPDTST